MNSETNFEIDDKLFLKNQNHQILIEIEKCFENKNINLLKNYLDKIIFFQNKIIMEKHFIYEYLDLFYDNDNFSLEDIKIMFELGCKIDEPIIQLLFKKVTDYFYSNYFYFPTLIFSEETFYLFSFFLKNLENKDNISKKTQKMFLQLINLFSTKSIQNPICYNMFVLWIYTIQNNKNLLSDIYFHLVKCSNSSNKSLNTFSLMSESFYKKYFETLFTFYFDKEQKD